MGKGLSRQEIQDAVDALASVAELSAMSPRTRIRAIRALDQHWPDSRPVLHRVVRNCSYPEVIAAARKVLARHERD